MKKLVAVLLVLAMTASCVACTKEETTKKKKKTKKTTEEIETEDPDAPSESSETEETDPTQTESETETESESSSDTSAAPDIGSFTISHDLTSANIEREEYALMYGAIDTTKPYPGYGAYLSSVELYFDCLYTEDGPSTYNEVLDDYNWRISEAKFNEWESTLEEFTDLVHTDSELFSYRTYNRAIPIRADSQLLSFYNYTSGYATNQQLENYSRYENYRASDGSPILFDDVILDKDAFIVYLKDYLEKMYVDTTTMEQQIKDGTFTFGMTYDGLIIGFHKLPVFGHEDIFDMSYFGSTPENYTLMIDYSNQLIWDFDGDGKLDELKLTANTNGSYSISSVTIEFMGKSYELDAKDYEEMEWMEEIDTYGCCYVMCVEGNYYLLLCMDCEWEDYMTYIFDLNGDAPEYIECYPNTPSNTIDPTCFTFDDRVDIMGTMFLDFEYGLTADGHIKQISTMGRGHKGVYQTKVDLNGYAYDMSTGTTSYECTIHADSKIEVVGYDIESGLLIVNVLSEYVEGDGIWIALETDKYDTIAGVQRDDAFIGLLYTD